MQFIDPLFELLGWDVRNTRGHTEMYKDVVLEDAVRTPDARTQLENQIAATDRLIDKLVYDLYDLGQEEVAIVEQACS